MATVYSGYTSTGTYTKTRVKVDYSGTSATATLLYTRTNTYSGATGGSGTFTFGGKSTSFNKTFYGQQTDATVTSVSFTISTAGGTYSGSSTGASYLAFSGSVNIPAQATNPTAGDTTVNSRTWNSVNLTGKVSSWGTYTGSNQAFCLAAIVSSATAWGSGRREYQNLNPGTATSLTGTINNDSVAGDGGITLKGCTSFKVGTYCRNGSSKDNSKVMGTVYYLPPAPLQTLSVNTQTPSDTADQVTIKLNITGGNSTNNENVTVTTEYRTNIGGAGWGAWTSAGTGTPWTTKNPTFTTKYNQSVQVEARQVYQSQYSEVKSLSFTSQAATAPTGTVEVISKTPHTITLKGTVTNWGHPSNLPKPSGSGNQNSGWLRVGDGSSSHGTLEVGMSTAPQTITITNGSARAHGGLVRLYPGEVVYPDMYLSNGLAAKAITGTTTTLPNTHAYVANNKKSDEIKYGYVSVNGKSKSIKKIYVSKNGKSKLGY